MKQILSFDYKLAWEYYLSVYNRATLVGKGNIHRVLPSLA